MEITRLVMQPTPAREDFDSDAFKKGVKAKCIICSNNSCLCMEKPL
jgi:hypothetical protein